MKKIIKRAVAFTAAVATSASASGCNYNLSLDDEQSIVSIDSSNDDLISKDDSISKIVEELSGLTDFSDQPNSYSEISYPENIKPIRPEEFEDSEESIIEENTVSKGDADISQLEKEPDISKPDILEPDISKPDDTQKEEYSSQVQEESSIEIPEQPDERPKELTIENINDVEVFKYFAWRFEMESLKGAILRRYNYTYDGVQYTTDGEIEFELLLALLNIDYMDSETLSELFSEYSLDDLKRISFFHYMIVYIVNAKKTSYDFNQYSLDKNIGRKLMEFQNAVLEFDGNYENLEGVLVDYFIEKKDVVSYPNSNAFIDYYAATYYNKYRLVFEGLQENEELHESVREANSVVLDRYFEQVTRLYEKIHSNEKGIQKTKIYNKS